MKKKTINLNNWKEAVSDSVQSHLSKFIYLPEGRAKSVISVAEIENFENDIVEIVSIVLKLQDLKTELQENKDHRRQLRVFLKTAEDKRLVDEKYKVLKDLVSSVAYHTSRF